MSLKVYFNPQWWYTFPEILCDGCNFYLLFWVIFCPFTLLTAQKIKILKKWKTPLDVSLFYMLMWLLLRLLLLLLMFFRHLLSNSSETFRFVRKSILRKLCSSFPAGRIGNIFDKVVTSSIKDNEHAIWAQGLDRYTPN